MAIVIPTILATTEEKYLEDLEKVKSCPELIGNWVQIDLMDKKFVPNLSVGLDVVEKYNDLPKKEAHLMVIDPENWVEKLSQLGFKRVLFPIEVGSTQTTLDLIKKHGMQCGISINPATNIEILFPFIDQVDVILCMGVNPGFQGQEFITSVVDKIRVLIDVKKDKNLSFEIEVDGGIDTENARMIVDAGADILAVGSKLFNGNISQNLEKFKEVLNG